MRISTDRGRPSGKQAIHVLLHEYRAMTLVEHVGFTDVLVDSSRLRRQIRERVRVPAVYVVVLRKGERTTVKLDDPHRDPGVGELLAFVFSGGSAPPFTDVCCHTPARDQREVCFDETAEVVRAHQPIIPFSAER